MREILIQVREKGDVRDWEDIPADRYCTDFPDLSARAIGREREGIGREVVQVRWQLYAAEDEGQFSGHYIDFPEEPQYRVEDLHSPLRRSNWIPITDQLPADGQKCWTYQPENETWHRFEEIVTVHRFHENYRNNWGGWWIGIENDAGNFGLWKTLSSDPDDDPILLITHWMPYEVPDPPGGVAQK